MEWSSCGCSQLRRHAGSKAALRVNHLSGHESSAWLPGQLDARSTNKQGDHRPDQEHHEEHFCDTCGTDSNPAETQNTRNYRDDEEYNCIVKQETLASFCPSLFT